MSMIGRQIVPGTPRDEPRPRYETVTDEGGSPGQGASLRRLSGAREPGEWSPGSHQRAKRIWDYVDRAVATGRVHTETKDEGEDAQSIQVFGDDPTAEQDRKLRRGFHWLERQNARMKQKARDQEADSWR